MRDMIQALRILFGAEVKDRDQRDLELDAVAETADRATAKLDRAISRWEGQQPSVRELMRETRGFPIANQLAPEGSQHDRLRGRAS